MTPELATIAQIGLKSEGFDPGIVDGIWGANSEHAFAQWQGARFRQDPQILPGLAPAWLAIARKEVGTSEIFGTRHNPRILEYHAKTKLGARDDETAWCASFVCWCLEEAGVKSTQSAWAKDFMNWGKAISELRLGAICVLSRGDNSGHVAFLERWDDERLWLLGGNQSNGVNITSFPRSRLLGVRWPT